MLSAISYGAVEGYDEGQDEVIYLCSTVRRVLDLGAAWAVTDRHAELAVARFFTDSAAIAAEVDWPLMNERYWASTPEDPDRKECRQAELLVHERVPWSAVHFVGTCTAGTLGRVEAILDDAGLDHRPKVDVRAHWYFEEKS